MLRVEKDAQGCPTVTVRCGIFVLRKDGILLGKPTAVDVDLAGAQEMIAAMNALVPSGPMWVMLDQRNSSRKLNTEARTHMNANTKRMAKLAVVVGSAMSRFFASGLLMIAGMSSKVRVFDDERSAVSWLQGQRAVASAPYHP